MKHNRKQRERTDGFDTDFMSYLGGMDYGDYNAFGENDSYNDETGLQTAGEITTEKNDLFGFYGEPEASYSGLSESTQPDQDMADQKKQIRKYKIRRMESLSLGGEPQAGESNYSRNNRSYEEFFGGKIDNSISKYKAPTDEEF